MSGFGSRIRVPFHGATEKGTATQKAGDCDALTDLDIKAIGRAGLSGEAITDKLPRRDGVPAGSAALPKCSHCGAHVSGLPHARAGDVYCCESCFLASHRIYTLPAGTDNGERALGEALVAALDAREHETGLHSKRVACHTLVLARHFTTSARDLRLVYLGALLHDIGKIGIPDAILLKHGSLSDAEWRIMRSHPGVGHRILASVPSMATAAELVLAHEERYDGTGYPRGLSGASIPLWARLFAIIDTLDAMTSDRPYREALPFDAARAEIARKSGTQFDPGAVEIFMAEAPTLRGMVALKCGTADVPSGMPT